MKEILNTFVKVFRVALVWFLLEWRSATFEDEHTAFGWIAYFVLCFVCFNLFHEPKPKSICYMESPPN